MLYASVPFPVPAVWTHCRLCANLSSPLILTATFEAVINIIPILKASKLRLSDVTWPGSHSWEGTKLELESRSFPEKV